MRKCNCTVLYRYIDNNYELIKINVKHKYNNIPFNSMLWQDKKYDSFNRMFKRVLSLLKANNFYVHKWEEFNSTWYDIDFIDIDRLEIERYSLK